MWEWRRSHIPRTWVEHEEVSSRNANQGITTASNALLKKPSDILTMSESTKRGARYVSHVDLKVSIGIISFSS